MLRLIYPSDQQLEKVEVRGIYLSKFVDWNAFDHAQHMITTWNFDPGSYERERTFNRNSKIEDHANDVHDYLKLGYGRATDDASMEIRHGRISREEGVEMVKRCDCNEPTFLDFYCQFLGISKSDFYSYVDAQRDPQIWKRHSDRNWDPTDSVCQHPIGELEEKTRVTQKDTRTFGPEYKHLLFNHNDPPEPIGSPELDENSVEFFGV